MPTFQQIQTALQNVMTVQPPVEFSLSPDSSVLADVFATMQYFHQTDRTLEQLTEKQRTAYQRWKTADTQV